MSTDDEPGTNKIDRIVEEQRLEIHLLRKKYNELGADAQVSDDLHRRLAAETVSYEDSLLEHRDESAIDHDWPSVVDEIRERLGKTASVQREPAGRSRSKTTQEVPAVMQIPIREIVKATHQLDDIAKDLGFSPTVRDATPSTEADKGDLRGLVDIRGQDAAKENLPGED